MHILTLLTQDHRNLTALFNRVPDALDDPAELEHLTTLISEHISQHASIEEQLLYPALLANAGDERMTVLKALEDHHAAEQTLLEALALAPTDERLGAKLLLLSEVIPHHVEQEEDVLFDLARRVLSHPELEAMGEQAEELKETAPTRPHPHLTGKPVLQTLFAIPIGICDRILTTGRQLVGTAVGFR